MTSILDCVACGRKKCDATRPASWAPHPGFQRIPSTSSFLYTMSVCHPPLPTKIHFLPPSTSNSSSPTHLKPYHLRSIRGGANPTTRWSARSLELSAPRLPCPRRLLAHSPAPEFLRLPIYRLHREILAQAAAGAAHRLFDFDPRTACVRGLPPGIGAASRLCAAPIAVPGRIRAPGLVAVCPTLLCK